MGRQGDKRPGRPDQSGDIDLLRYGLRGGPFVNVYLRKENCYICKKDVYYDVDASTVTCDCGSFTISYIDEFDLAHNWIHVQSRPLCPKKPRIPKGLLEGGCTRL